MTQVNFCFAHVFYNSSLLSYIVEICQPEEESMNDKELIYSIIITLSMSIFIFK